MRISGFIRFLKNNIPMIAVTVAAILIYHLWIPLDIKLFFSQYSFSIVFAGFAVVLCILLLPVGIKMIRQAKNGEVNAGPLTPGKIIDTFPVPDEDEGEMGFLYVVSFVNNNGLRSLGYTQVFHGEQKYHKGDTVNLWDIAKQAKAPGESRDARPTYDVGLWDEQSAADELKATRFCGRLIVGITVLWVLIAFVVVCIYI